MDMNQKTREHETHHSHDTITVQHCFHEHDQKHEHVHGHHHHHGKLPAILYMIGLVIFVASLILLTGFEQKIFLLVAMILSGYHVLLEGVVDTIEASLTAHRLRPNAHILMFIAAMGAVYLGDIKEGALLIFIFAGVHFLEDYVSNQSKKAIEELLSMQPQLARKIQADGTIVEITANKLEVGDHIQVLNGMQVPIDGVIVKGSSSFNEASITGESIPVEKNVGENVYGSAINLGQTVEITASKVYDETVFAKIIQIVQQAQQNVPPVATKIQRFEPIYVNVVLSIFIGILVIGSLFSQLFSANIFEQALIFLVAASPCALAVAVIPATLSAMSNLARKGVLFKGGNYIYQLKDLKAIAFDKTGTLTQGQPSVVNNYLESNVIPNDVLAQLIYSMESQVNHPLAQAIVSFLAKEVQNVLPINVTNEVGKGVSTYYNQHLIQLGKPNLFSAMNNEWQEKINNEQMQGKTVILVVVDHLVCGYFAIQDQEKPSAVKCIQQLTSLGIQSIMLTGDSNLTGEAIAKQLGINRVCSNVLPNEKAQYIQKLKKQYGQIAMVGDGMNDAPALAVADIGFAMEQGSDIAIETADAVIMQNDLTKLVEALSISKRLNKIVQQNIIFAITVVILLVLLTFTNHLSVVSSVSLHEGSTLLVLLNSLRLLMQRP